MTLSRRVIKEYPLKKLLHSSIQELIHIKGIGKAKAAKIAAVSELAKRSEKTTAQVQIKNPQEAFNHFKYLASKEQEECYVLHLNTKHHIIKEELVFRGTINQATIHPRELFKSAIRENAFSIIIIHNHPSGDPMPSVEDLEITKIIKEVGELVGIHVIDHVIIGKGKYFSFEEQGLLG
jgi:DNA repair protein RadC